MFKVRSKNIQVILLLEDENVKELKDALTLGIYDLIFDPFGIDDILKCIKTPTSFSKVSNYIKEILELETN